jgi:tetratricopeptide (TPR) repeat protein
MNLAERYARQNDFGSAIPIVESLVAQAPHLPWLWERLGELKAAVGQFDEAAAHFRTANERKPGDPSLLYKWARATFDCGALVEAQAILERAERLAPKHEAIFGLRCEIHERNADWDALGGVADAWLTAQPQNPLPYRFAASAQWETGYLGNALQSFRIFLHRGGASAESLATFARLCLLAGEWDEAERALAEAQRLDPRCAPMLSAKATLAMFRGRFDEAGDYARKATRYDPRDTAAFKVLIEIPGGGLSNDEAEQLGRLVDDDALPLKQRIAAAFAVADHLDARDRIDEAFSAYAHAHALALERGRRENLHYDRVERERYTDRLISLFPSVAPPAAADSRPFPIFIVGMPRSGTTVVESILAAHTRVRACGERQEMRTVMQEFMAAVPQRRVTDLAPRTRQRWREDWLRELRDIGGALAVTDKNPWNFDALGLIADVFPDARLVHVRRDAVETGLSIFRHEFPKFATFADRLEDIGHYYGEYARLMAHWESLLGPRLMTIRYEDLVADVGTMAATLLRFCGLEWEEACRDFWRGDRLIATMSAAQARQPVAAFDERRGRYEAHAGPLVAALRAAGVEVAARALSPD